MRSSVFLISKIFRISFLWFCLLAYDGLASQSVKISSFGSENPSASLYLAMKSSFDTIVIDKQEDKWYLRPMKFENINSKVIVVEPGAAIGAMPGAFPRTTDALFTFTDCNNITIIGNGAELCMNKNEYIDGEWRMGISIRGSKRVVIKDLIIRDTGGDGIYLSGSKKNRYCEDISIDNIKSINNKRQGLSIMSAKNVRIANSSFTETSGTLPGAGIDIEPNRPRDVISNIRVVNCSFRNNFGAGVKIALDKLTGDSEKVSITFKNCILANNHAIDNPKVAAEITFDANKIDPVNGKVIFDQCLVENSNWGLMYSRKRADAYSVVFTNCAAIEMSKKGTWPIIYLEVPDYYGNYGDLGGFEIRDLYVESKSSISLITIRGSRLGTLNHLRDIFADITYEGQFINPMKYIKYNPEFNDNVILELTEKF